MRRGGGADTTAVLVTEDPLVCVCEAIFSVSAVSPPSAFSNSDGYINLFREKNTLTNTKQYVSKLNTVAFVLSIAYQF